MNNQNNIALLKNIPKEWKIEKHEKHFETCMGKTILKKDVKEEGSIPVYSATEEDKIFGYVEEDTQKMLKKGDIVIPARGCSIGAVKYIEKKATSTQTTIQAKCESEELVSKYIYYYMLAFRKELFKHGGAATPQITVGEINQNYIIIPPIKTQENIIKFLDKKVSTIGNIIQKIKKIVTLLNEKIEADIFESINLSNIKAKYKCKVEMVELAKLTLEIENLNQKNNQETEIQYIEIGNVNYLKGIHGIRKMKLKDAPNGTKRILKENDVIVSNVRTYLKAIAQIKNMNTDNLISTSALTVIRANDKALSSYLYWAVQSKEFIDETTSKSAGSTYPTIKTTKMLAIKIPITDKSIQKIIAEELDEKIYYNLKLIEKFTNSITKFEEYRESVIYEAVTGITKI